MLRLVAVTALAYGLNSGMPACGQPAFENVTIDAHAPAHPFAHFWDQVFGSGRASLAMREN
ncbi:MAG: glycosyl hydrolase family 39, partial [Terracidiphilus sp.]